MTKARSRDSFGSPRWVLYVDISGFTRALSKDPHRLTSAYRAVVDGVNARSAYLRTLTDEVDESEPIVTSQTIADSDELRTIRIFSDSIFLFYKIPEPSMAWALNSMMFDNAQMISEVLWANRIPFRGAISFGNCHIEEQIFLGEPIARAASWEGALDWMGISVEPASLKAFRAMCAYNGGTSATLLDFPVPTKHGHVPTLCVPFPPGDKARDGFVEAYEEVVSQGLVALIPRYVHTAQFMYRCGVKHPVLEEMTRYLP